MKRLTVLCVMALLVGWGVLAGCGGGQGFVVTPTGKKLRINGTVRDAQGNPVANATIVGPPGSNISVQTDADGNFRVRLPLGVVELIASAGGFLENGISVEVMAGGERFVAIVLTAGVNPPLAGNQPPQVGTLTVTPGQVAVVGRVTFNVTISDNDSANLTAVAVVEGPDGTLTGVGLTRAGNQFSGTFAVAPNANRNAPPQVYRVIVGATDADNGSNRTVISSPVTFTVNPPQAPPGQPL